MKLTLSTLQYLNNPHRKMATRSASGLRRRGAAGAEDYTALEQDDDDQIADADDDKNRKWKSEKQRESER
jgi:hypothetical protein